MGILLRCGGTLVAAPLVAERAFLASYYLGLTRVSDVHGKLQEPAGVSNELQTPAIPLCKDREGAPGLSIGVGVRHLVLGVPKPGCFKPGCLKCWRGSTLLRSFAPFLRSYVCALLHSFALFCVLLKSGGRKEALLALGNG